MALRLAWNHPHRCAGAASFGGPLPAHGRPLRHVNALRQMPCFLASGRHSEVYPEADVCRDLRLLHAAGCTVALRQYPCGDELTTVMLALGGVGAAYMAETIRAGIQAVPKGQVEAARSLGMSQSRAMITIVIPQAFRIILPPLTNELILLTKDSSLIYILGLFREQYELTKFGRETLSRSPSLTPILIAGLCYLIITLPLGYLSRYLERRGTGGRKKVSA